MSEFGRADGPVLFLVEDAEALHEVLERRGVAVLADRLQDGQEHLETDAVVCKRNRTDTSGMKHTQTRTHTRRARARLT